MQTCPFVRSSLAGILLFPAVHTCAHAQYAAEVVGYTAGSGIAPGYTNPNAALGEPSRVTPGEFGGPVDPFSPAYLNSQLVSVGDGGSLTIRFDSPVQNDPLHASGIDFLIFGGAGFIITNAFDESFQFIGTPATDGSLFGAQSGTSRIQVSQDGVQFFTLDPNLAPEIERLFPTDGQGDFHTPVDPRLSNASFAGLTLEDLRLQYQGSGGGAGYDLSWARDAQNQPVALDYIQFVRVEMTGGKAEIDAFSAVQVVPEPRMGALLLAGLGALYWIRRTQA